MKLKYHQPLLKPSNKLKLLKKEFHHKYLSWIAQSGPRTKETKNQGDQAQLEKEKKTARKEKWIFFCFFILTNRYLTDGRSCRKIINPSILK